MLGYININNDIHFYVTKGEENTTTDVWLSVNSKGVKLNNETITVLKRLSGRASKLTASDELGDVLYRDNNKTDFPEELWNLKSAIILKLRTTYLKEKYTSPLEKTVV
jgi:hypothetical protein